MSLCSLASYLASLNAPVVAPNLGEGSSSPLESGSSSDSPSTSSLEGSPMKRARADSPDTSIASSSPADYFARSTITSAFAYKDDKMGDDHLAALPSLSTYSLTASNLLAASAPSPITTCPAIRSILTTSFTPIGHSAELDTPLTAGGLSEPTSRPLSRRSSTGASSTTKSVRFARCTNASVFPALGVDEYDRSPIVPTCESESLQLPKRQNKDDDGWIKCVERERAAAAKRVASGQALPACSPSMENPVEGKHGLIEGGYFVGEERDQTAALDEEDEDRMVVDDEETGAAADDDDDDDDVALIQDDSSGDDEPAPQPSEPVVAPAFTTSPISEVDLLKHATLNAAICAAVKSTTPTIDVTPTGSPALSSTSSFAPVLESDASKASGETSSEEISTPDISSAEDVEEDAEAKAARLQQEKKDRAKKCRERYGLCALGKYTRAEVFSSYDSLGGF